MSNREQQSQEPENLSQTGEQQGGALGSSEEIHQGVKEDLTQGQAQEQQGGALSSSEKSHQGTKEALEQEAENRSTSEQQGQ